MPTTVHIVRHAQGVHNLSNANQLFPDPELTPLGEQQCAQLRRSFDRHDKITHLLSSPMRRTLQTTLLSFSPALDPPSSLTVLAIPLLQEISTLPCDVGSPPAALARQFPPDKVDLSLLTDDWMDKSAAGPNAPEYGALERRAQRAREFIRDLGRGFEEKEGRAAEVVVVTHGGFAHFLTGDFEGSGDGGGTGWGNAEGRTFVFEEEGEGARLRETGESWRGRRGSLTRLGEDEQRELRVAMEGVLKEEFGGEELGGEE
ncbi:histidine phosphatase superfamily [Schizothecium vesticola]|uniref:Histidine phosphatase superfamily n=1 Tax=Schizothecium vesticola TaxID=314040 RepID=A0AA40EPR0_9PEZI|nr:histidine phosphatase superfamily [Schizothecium vesticola]